MRYGHHRNKEFIGVNVRSHRGRQRHRIPVIYLQTLSLGLYNSLRFCPNGGDYTTGALGAFFCNDHTHFETYGAQQIARLVAGALRTRNIPLAVYLK